MEQKGKTEERKPIIAIYDADFIMFYVCPNKKGEPEKTLEQCIELCDNLIYNMNASVKADYYGGFLTIGKCFRYKLNPEYKANRKYENMPKFIKDIKLHLIKNHGFRGQRGYEADDLVISFKAQMKQYETIIISPDKDILGSVDVAYNPRKNAFVANSKEQIEENFWKSMITGDSVDGIKSIPGKGEVYFNKYKEYYSNFGYKQVIIDLYTQYFGEYKGIQEFYKNYVSLKLIDNVQLKRVKLNKVTQVTFL